MGQGYGSLYVSNGVAPQAVTTVEAKVAAFATAGPAAGSIHGGNQDVIADATNKRLLLRRGVYQLSFSLAIKDLYSAVALTARAFKNGVGIPGMFTRMVGTALSGASFASGSSLIAFSGLIEITEADLSETETEDTAYPSGNYAAVDVRLSCPVGTLTVTPTYGQLAAVRMAD